jgi:hypothetical protein
VDQAGALVAVEDDDAAVVRVLRVRGKVVPAHERHAALEIVEERLREVERGGVGHVLATAPVDVEDGTCVPVSATARVGRARGVAAALLVALERPELLVHVVELEEVAALHVGLLGRALRLDAGVARHRPHAVAGCRHDQRHAERGQDARAHARASAAGGRIRCRIDAAYERSSV